MRAFRFVFIINVLIFLLGCKKSEEGIFLKGNIVGFVHLTDENGKVVEDKSGVNVSIEGLTNSANTNEIGRFELTNVPAGTYNLIYSKTGYGIQKIFSFQFIGGNIPALLYGNTTLYEQPNIEIQNLAISYKNNTINISGNITEKNQYIIETFINDSSNVSHQDYDFSFYEQRLCCGPATQFSQIIYLNETPYTLGDKLFLVIYFLNPYEQTGYYDYEKQKKIYTSYKKASNIIELSLD